MAQHKMVHIISILKRMRETERNKTFSCQESEVRKNNDRVGGAAVSNRYPKTQLLTILVLSHDRHSFLMLENSQHFKPISISFVISSSTSS